MMTVEECKEYIRENGFNKVTAFELGNLVSFTNSKGDEEEAHCLNGIILQALNEYTEENYCENEVEFMEIYAVETLR